MKSRFVALTFFVFLPLVGIGDETDEQYRQLVDEVLEVTGALKISEQMSVFMVSEMTRALKEADEVTPDRVYELIASEVNLVIREEIDSGSFNELMYPIYRKYLDASDLEATIKFYTSKEGKKIASLLPQLTQEGMIAGQSWGASVGPKIVERVGMRLSEEGIEIPSPPPVANYSVVQLPELTDDQNWKRAEFLSMTFILVSVAYAEEHGDGIEEYGRWLGKQFAPSWGEEGSGTPAGLIRGWYHNTAAWQGLEFEVMEATDGIVKARSNRPWASYFDEEDWLGVTEGEFDRLWALIYDEIANYLGLDFDQAVNGDHLVITVRRR